jgi:transcriptional regulator with XRE-family HTH domain
LNETLRRALLRARLSEEDVAARLEVDPKTVRRWLEGRVPYLRYRWAIASMLGLDETDLWPELSARTRPDEVRAIYPHRDDVPRDLWRTLFGSAEREIGILANSGLFLAEDPGIIAAIDERARDGVRVRICLRLPNAPDSWVDNAGPGPDDKLVVRIHKALAQFGPLRQAGDVKILLHRAVLNNTIYRADDELLVAQHVYGIRAGQAPVLHLRPPGSSDMVTTYLESFEDVWADTRTAPWRSTARSTSTQPPSPAASPSSRAPE